MLRGLLAGDDQDPVCAKRFLPPTPLRAHVTRHVRGLQALGRGDVGEARRLLEDAAPRWAAFGTVSEERAARADLASIAGA